MFTLEKEGCARLLAEHARHVQRSLANAGMDRLDPSVSSCDVFHNVFHFWSHLLAGLSQKLPANAAVPILAVFQILGNSNHLSYQDEEMSALGHCRSIPPPLRSVRIVIQKRTLPPSRRNSRFLLRVVGPLPLRGVSGALRWSSGVGQASGEETAGGLGSAVRATGSMGIWPRRGGGWWSGGLSGRADLASWDLGGAAVRRLCGGAGWSRYPICGLREVLSRAAPLLAVAGMLRGS